MPQGGTKEVIQGGEFGINLTTVLECFLVLSKTCLALLPPPAALEGKGPCGTVGGTGSAPGGLYIRLECYQPGALEFGVEASNAHAWR